MLLDLETDELGEWIRLHDDRNTAAFANLHRQEVERLAQEALDRITGLAGDTVAYRKMRQSARATAIELFSADDANGYWDVMYDRAIDEVIASMTLSRQHTRISV